MFNKYGLICILLLGINLAYADGDMSDDNNVVGTTTSSTNVYSDSQITAQANANASAQSIQNLANFLAQNPGLAQQVEAALNQPPSTTAANATPAAPAPTPAADIKGSPWDINDSTKQDINNNAFNAVAQQAFPLTPDQIKMLNSMLDATQRAQAAPANNDTPTPVSTSLMVNLAPGTTPPVIRLSRGFVSSLVFIDSTGQPWPIESYDIGNPTAFNIVWDKKSNTLMIQAKAAYTYGNLAVKLINLNTPVMLTLVPGQKVVDYRIDLRIEGLGPNAQNSMIQSTGLPDQANPVLLNVLDGVPPPGAKRLSVSSNVVQVWVVDNTMFVRTQFTLLSPAWISKMSSADGMNAYQLQITPLLLLSRYGKILQIKVEGL